MVSSCVCCACIFSVGATTKMNASEHRKWSNFISGYLKILFPDGLIVPHLHDTRNRIHIDETFHHHFAEDLVLCFTVHIHELHSFFHASCTSGKQRTSGF